MRLLSALTLFVFMASASVSGAYEQLPMNVDLVHKAVKSLQNLTPEQISKVYFQDSRGVMTDPLKEFLGVDSEQSAPGYAAMETHFDAIWYDQYRIHDFHHIRGLVFGCSLDTNYYTGVKAADDLNDNDPEGSKYLVCTYNPVHTGPNSLDYNGPFGTFSHGAWYYLIFNEDASVKAITPVPQG